MPCTITLSPTTAILSFRGTILRFPSLFAAYRAARKEFKFTRTQVHILRPAGAP